MKKYYIYIRKSSDREDKQTLTIESQKKILKELQERLGLHVVKVFYETKSAYKAGRAEFNKMIAGIERGEANAILCVHLTRIARNPLDGGKVIYLMDEGKIVEIITPDSTYVSSNDDHKFLMQIHFAMAKKSSDDTSKFVKRDNANKLSKGETITMAPIGMLNIDKDGRISGKQYCQQKQKLLLEMNRPLKRLEIDPIDGPFMFKVLEKAANTTASVPELTKFAQEIGVKTKRGKPITKSTLGKALHNPTYYGLLKSKGTLYKGDFTPLITKKMFDKIQQNLESNSKPRKQSHSFKYCGFIKCRSCGGSITAEKQKGNIYYRCTKKKKKDFKCQQPYTREEYLEQQILDYLKKIQIHSDFIDWAVETLKENLAEETKLQRQIRTQTQNKLEKLKTRQKTLINAFLDGDIEKPAYQEHKAETQNEIAALEEELANQSICETDFITGVENYFDFAKNIVKNFQQTPSEERKDYLEAIGSNFKLDNRELRLEFNEIYTPLIKLNEAEAKLAIKRLEPQNSSPQATKALFAEKLNSWGG